MPFRRLFPLSLLLPVLLPLLFSCEEAERSSAPPIKDRDSIAVLKTSDIISYISEAFGHISRIDQHMPFSDPRCNRLLEILRPEYVTHEMPGSKAGMLEDFRQQRSLLP